MKNVKTADSYSRLVDICTGYGGTYNPGRPTLQIGSLVAQLQQARAALEEVINAKSLFDVAVNKRKQEFDQLPKLASSILRTLEASGATPEMLDDARTFSQLISGASPKSRKVVAEGETTPTQRATLQLAYISRAESFEKLVKAVVNEPLYLSNEPHLSVAGLVDKVNELNNLNHAVSRALANWNKARKTRDTVLYFHQLSVVSTGRAVKQYIRAIFGLASKEYAEVKVLRFTKPTK